MIFEVAGKRWFAEKDLSAQRFIEGSTFCLIFSIGEFTFVEVVLVDLFSFFFPSCGGERSARAGCARVTSAPLASSLAAVFLCFAMGGSLCIVNQVCLSQRWVLLWGEDVEEEETEEEEEERKERERESESWT